MYVQKWLNTVQSDTGRRPWSHHEEVGAVLTCTEETAIQGHMSMVRVPLFMLVSVLPEREGPSPACREAGR